MPKRIHQLADLGGGESLTGSYFEADINVGAGEFKSRRVPFASLGGGGGDVSQNVTASTATTIIDPSLGNIIYIQCNVNTELSIDTPVANVKYTIILFKIVGGTLTITFDATFNGADGEPIQDAVLDSTLSADELISLDFLCTNAGTSVTLRARNDITGGLIGAGSDSIIDLGERLTGSEIFDLGLRV
jgi:hypothetical protein